MKNNIRIAGIVDDSIVDGPGIRLTIFFQGCSHQCINCHNPNTWDFNGGYLISIDDICKRIYENPLLQGITLSGGDPLFQAESAANLCLRIKNERPDLDIILYTGFLYEEVLNMSKTSKEINKLLNNLDFIVDGPFIENLKDLTLNFRGSSNQRIIDVKKSIMNNKLCTIEWR